MFERGNRLLERVAGNCDPPGGGHVFTRSGSQGLLTNVNSQSMSTAKEGSSCGTGDKLPVPGLVDQVIEFHKSGSVPQVESEAKVSAMGRAKALRDCRWQSSVQGSADSFAVWWLVTTAVLSGTSNDESGDGLCACPRMSRLRNFFVATSLGESSSHA